MDSLIVLALSPQAGFSKKIRDGINQSQSFMHQLPGVEIHKLSSLDHPSENLDLESVGAAVIDLDSIEDSPDQLLQKVQSNFPYAVVVFVTESPEKLPSDLISGAYVIASQDIKNPLFGILIKTLLLQSELTANKSAVQKELENRLNELHSIRKAGLSLTMNLSLDAVLEAILESALELISADDTHIFLYEHGSLSFASALFEGKQQNKPFMNPRPHGLTYQVAREGKLKVVNDTMLDPLFEDRPWQGSIISLPLKIGNKVLGVMNVALHRPHDFTENEIRALEFLGDQAAIAIQNAKLYEQAQREIADRKKAEKAIQHLANHDALTGLPNRRLFNERIIVEISRAERNKQRIGVMLFDLDQLKNVNDSFGHNVGDMLLQAVAQRLLGLLRKSDTVARMGGDEFLLILPEMQKPMDAVQTAERILDALSTPFLLEGYQVDITTSIGISFYPDDGADAESLIKNADIAMYKAKEKGGNTYHLFTS